MSDIRPLSERELNDYLAACSTASDEELLDLKAADGVSLRDILTDANEQTCPACGKPVYRAVYPASDPKTACVDPECVNAHGITTAAAAEDREVSFTLTAKDLHPETLALLTGLHPAHFEGE